MNKLKKSFFHKKLPIIIGIVLALILSAVFFIVLNLKNKDKGAELALYQQEFPQIFADVKDEYSKDQTIPQLTKTADHYQAQNSRFSAEIPAETYQKPLVFEKRGYKLDIAPINAGGGSAQSISPQANLLIYKNAYQSTDIIKKIQPDGVKEFIILKSQESPKQFEFVFNVSDQTEVRKEEDGAVRFYKKNTEEEQKIRVDGLSRMGPDNFLFRIPAPYLIDINKTKSLDCQWQLDKIPASPDASQGGPASPSGGPAGGSDIQYKLTLTYNPINLNYPVALDPSITDTYDDETKVADKSNTEVTGGQVRLTQTSTSHPLSGWSYRKLITIQTTNLDANQTDFPLYVKINADADIGAAARSDGYDIRFTASDGVSLLKYERESFSIGQSSASADFWVKTSLSTGGTSIYIYYGNSGASDGQDPENVWDDNFMAVWHFPNGTVLSALDSTANNNDGTINSVLATSGKIDGGTLANDSNDYISLGNPASLNISGNITVSAWIKFSESQLNKPIIGRWSTDQSYILYIDHATDNRIKFTIRVSESSNTAVSVNAYNDDAWHFIVGVFNGSNVLLYVDQAESITGDATVGPIDTPAQNVYLLNYSDGGENAPIGTHDEFRISNTPRSASWIKFEYHNISEANNELTWGNQEVPTSGWLSGWQYRKQITINSTVVSESDAGLFDFPILINLASDSNLAAGAQSDGDDIVFTSADGQSKLDYEREKYDNEGDLIAWIRAPSLSSTSNTTLYMYYGNSGATNQENKTGTWDTNFKAVWHLPETSNPYLDSTQNNHDSTGGTYPTRTSDGQVDGAQDFELDSNQYLIIGDHTDFEMTGDATISVWVKTEAYVSDLAYFIMSKYSSDPTIEWEFMLYNNWDANAQGITFTIWNTSTAPWLGADTGTNKSINTWYYVVATLDNTSNIVRIYVNGALEDTDNAPSGTQRTSTTSIVEIANRDVDNNKPFDGIIDELRFSASLRDLYWISNEYNNMASTSAFYNVGSQTTEYPSSGTITSTNLLTQADSGPNWFNGNWQYRKKITIDHTYVDSDLTDFPLYVKIASDSDIGPHVRSDGYDLRFTQSDGTTLLKYERERFEIDTGTVDADIWVKVPTLAGASNTDIYVYYGNPNATDGQDAVNVWDANFKMVQHMKDATTSTIIDSTSNTITGNKTSANNPQETEGKIYKAQDFSSDMINCGNPSVLQFGTAITISAWIKPSSAGSGNDCIWGKDNDTTGVYLCIGASGNVLANIAPDIWWGPATGNLRDDAWHYVVFATSASATKVFVDGTTYTRDALAYVANTVNNAIIGAMTETPDGPWQGGIEKLWVSDIVRPDAWIKFEYRNIAEADNEQTLGTQEQPSATKIDTFYYNASAIPSGTGLEIQFSQDNINWYSASGSTDWTTLSATGGGSINLSGLGWSGESFYYKIQFYSNTAQTQTPVLDEIAVNYSIGVTDVRLRSNIRLRGGVRLKGRP